MKQKLYILLGGLSILTIVIIKFVFMGNTPIKDEVKTLDTKTVPINKDITNNKKEENNQDNNIKVSIISPDDKEFYSGDTRMWEAKIEGFKKGGNKDYECYWTWYVNGEKKWENLKSCKSIRAIPFNPGNLKVEVRVEFIEISYATGERSKKILETKTAQRDYVLLSK